MRKLIKLFVLTLVLVAPITLQANIPSPDLSCLMQAVQVEAGGEPHLGKESVAAVAITRAHKRFQGKPGSICSTLKQPGQFQWTKRRSIYYQGGNNDARNVARKLYTQYFIGKRLPKHLSHLRNVEYFARVGYHPIKGGRLVSRVGMQQFWDR